MDYSELLEKYGINSPSELEDALKTHKYLVEGKLTVVDINSYNHFLADLNEFLKLQNELGYDIKQFVQAFMQGDAMWAYHPGNRIIGEFKIEDPFSQEITYKRVEPNEVIPRDYDKSKPN